jgi:Family of unknown function (DUF5999)
MVMITPARRTIRTARGRHCPHEPPCPLAWRPDRLAAVVVAAHPEQGWYLLCNGIITFDDTGAIAAGKIIVPCRPSGRSPQTTGLIVTLANAALLAPG